MPPDFFISHATEDKNEVARPLAMELTKRGFTVWFDEFELRLGDSLTEKINEGLAKSQYGIVVLSESFFRKRWPQEELNGLMARSTSSQNKVILPIWHNITKAYLLEHAPILADKCAAKTSWGIDKIANNVASALPNLDFETRRLLLGKWQDPSDNDMLYIIDQGREVGGIYDFATKSPVGVLRGVLLEDYSFCYRWQWIKEPIQGAGRLSFDIQTKTMVGKWWYHETPSDTYDVRYEFVDGICPNWLTSMQIKNLMYELFYM
ncbi:MAG: toll/interleukin-1 receptor domain-containing protein [Xenococcus sp. (in: cyanobacteria)]